jgi:hypothetical protein
MLSCSEGKGHTFESCGARQFLLVFQRDACALNETVALSHAGEQTMVADLDEPATVRLLKRKSRVQSRLGVRPLRGHR